MPEYSDLKKQLANGYQVTIRRQHRTSLMMRLVPGGIEVFIPRWMKEDSPKVRNFIQAGLEKLGGSVPPIPVEQTSREQIEVMVKTWAERVGVQPGRLQFRTMSRKWGSCSSRDNITLNSRLTWLPPHLAEYVVLHELVHLQVFNHGKELKAMMSSHMPDWVERERELDSTTFK
jgi:predicted metal-dependent hydrolase